MSRAIDFRQVAQSPKSTLVGLCVLALAAERGVHFDAAGHLAMTARDWFGVGCGVLTALVSGLTQDAVQTTQGQPEPTAPEPAKASVSGSADL
jgi:hypothetical protein